MTLHFTVLASGSQGNASLIESDGLGLLIDAGLGPRLLQSRLAAFGIRWTNIRAALLTHMHGDHWNERTFKHFLHNNVLVCCHREHRARLLHCSEHFQKLDRADLVLEYEDDAELMPLPGVRVRPVALRHDSGATFGFRIEGRSDLYGDAPRIGYLSDMGVWSEDLLDRIEEVDLIALEFNHDVDLEWSSGRPRELVERVLGAEGHLSNEQAADLVAALLQRGDRLKHVVQLHLSRECNRPELARSALRRVIGHAEVPIKVHTAHQHRPGPRLAIDTNVAPRRPRLRVASGMRPTPFTQQLLPGWEE